MSALVFDGILARNLKINWILKYRDDKSSLFQCEVMWSQRTPVRDVVYNLDTKPNYSERTELRVVLPQQIT